MRFMPAVQRLRDWRRVYQSIRALESTTTEELVARLRRDLHAHGIDLNNPDDFYIVWAIMTVFISIQQDLGKQTSLTLASDSIYTALAAATPKQLH